MLQSGDRVALVACSDGLTARDRDAHARLHAVLAGLGLDVVDSPHLFVTNTPPPALRQPAPDPARAAALERFLADPEIAAVFDISGGNLVGGVLSHLDMEVVARHPTPFFGYSDLTVLVNALHARTGQVTHLWTVRNLVRSDGDAQVTRFRHSVLGTAPDLFDLEATMVRGDGMAGAVVGGNLRGVLKLAGTPWFPPVRGRILALESLNGSPDAVHAGLHQLLQIGVLAEVAGVLLGTFTALQRAHGADAPARLALEVLPPSVPLAVTRHFGHGSDSRALRIGADLRVDTS